MPPLTLETFAHFQQYLINTGVLNPQNLALVQSLAFLMSPDTAFYINSLWQPGLFGIFACWAIAMSLLSGYSNYFLGQYVARPFINGFFSPACKQWLHNIIQNHHEALLVASGVLPFSFRWVAMLCGVYGVSQKSVMAGLVVGRGVRFLVLGSMLLISAKQLPITTLELILLGSGVLSLLLVVLARRTAVTAATPVNG